MKTLSKHTKDILIVVLFLLLCGVGYFLYNARARINYQDNVIREKQASEVYWKDEAGRQLTQKAAAQISVRELQKNYHEEIARLNELQIKPRNVKSFTSLQATTLVSDIKPSLRIHQDNPCFFDFQWHDSTWVSLSGSYTGELKIDTLKVNNEITIVGYWEKRLFKEPKLNVIVRSENPYTQVTRIRNLDIEKHPKPGKWVVGPQFSMTYIEKSIRPTIGIGLTFKVLSF